MGRASVAEMQLQPSDLAKSLPVPSGSIATGGFFLLHSFNLPLFR